MFFGLVISVLLLKIVDFSGEKCRGSRIRTWTSCSQSRRDNPSYFYTPKKNFCKSKKNLFLCLKLFHFFAERKGFEPLVPVKVQLLSREPHSATLAPLQFLKNFFEKANVLQSYLLTKYS